MSPLSSWARRVLLALLALLLLGVLSWVTLRTGPLAPVKVQITEVARGRVSPEIFGIGQVQARRSWLVGPTVAGRVRSVAVDVGQVVQSGQVLAEMDPVDLDQRVIALDASLARAQSARAATQAQVADAQARRALAQANLKRNQDLARQKFISAGALEARQQEVASAEAGLLAAQANDGAATQDISRLQAERAALLAQRNNLRLLAPAPAVVASRDAEPGSTVVAGQSVLRLIDPASLWVAMRVDQGRSAGLAQGLAARITLRSLPGQTLAGRVERVELLADAVTEERMAMVAFEIAPAGVSVGEMAEVTLALPASVEGLLLPNAALQQHEGRTGVWRVQDGGLVFVPVSTGAQGLGGSVLVAPVDGAALAEGDRVVLYSQTALRPDARIRVVESLMPAGGAK
jgi:HlyD family secretion protein